MQNLSNFTLKVEAEELQPTFLLFVEKVTATTCPTLKIEGKVNLSQLSLDFPAFLSLLRATWTFCHHLKLKKARKIVKNFGKWVRQLLWCNAGSTCANLTFWNFDFSHYFTNNSVKLGFLRNSKGQNALKERSNKRFMTDSKAWNWNETFYGTSAQTARLQCGQRHRSMFHVQSGAKPSMANGNILEHN